MTLNRQALTEMIADFQEGKEIPEDKLIRAAALYVLSTAEPETIIIRDFVADSDVDEMLQQQIIYLKGYVAAKRAYQASATDGNKLKMCSELEKMMNLFARMFDVLRQGSMCPEERDRINKILK